MPASTTCLMRMCEKISLKILGYFIKTMNHLGQTKLSRYLGHPYTVYYKVQGLLVTSKNMAIFNFHFVGHSDIVSFGDME